MDMDWVTFHTLSIAAAKHHKSRLREQFDLVFVASRGSEESVDEYLKVFKDGV